MDQIAFIYGQTLIYWSSVVLALAVTAGVLFFWAAHMWRGGSVAAAAAAVPVAIVLSLLLSRYVHWYCRTDSYESFQAAMTDFSSGSYALIGAFGGCFLTALILKALRMIRDLPETLDCMSVAGCGAIALGRMACFFTSADRGQILSQLTRLPWAYPVINSVSGVLEYRLATFVIQAMVTAVIFVGLAVVFVFVQKRFGLRSGDVTLLFLMFYGASQVVLDSTRYDSIYLRSNGFVSIVQIFSALALVAPIVLFSIRLVKAGGFKRWYIGVWAAIAALVGGAGYMEYYVQRHGNQAVLAYSVMSSCLIGILILAVGLLILSLWQGRLHRMPTAYPTEPT